MLCSNVLLFNGYTECLALESKARRAQDILLLWQHTVLSDNLSRCISRADCAKNKHAYEMPTSGQLPTGA